MLPVCNSFFNSVSVGSKVSSISLILDDESSIVLFCSLPFEINVSFIGVPLTGTSFVDCGCSSFDIGNNGLFAAVSDWVFTVLNGS